MLVCPACQPAALADLTRCANCAGVHLIRRLDQVECLDCRHIREAAADPAPSPRQAGDAPGLAAEVASALQRLLGDPGR